MADVTDDVPLTDPTEVDVYHIVGASEVQPAGIRGPLGSNLGGRAERDIGIIGPGLGGLAVPQDTRPVFLGRGE